MELAELIERLADPAAYPQAVDRVEVRHTHISVVFLAGPHAYKIKKPVNLGFLDFTTLEKRRHFCEEEVRLNRRLAPTVYHGVVPMAWTGQAVKVEAPGQVVEWAVKMERLPEEAMLGERLRRGEAGQEQVAAVARTIAAFHAAAEANARTAAFGRFPVVAGNARENFAQAVPQIGTTISRAVFDRLQTASEVALVHWGPLIENRANQGMSRDTHGDLHLDHVYCFPERPPPADLVIIDCIEFNERFRFGNPVADMAFLVMDLLFQRRPDLARVFAEAYFQASDDATGRPLLPFYTAYRAAVRAKVEGFELVEKEIPEAERARALAHARAHWLLALSQLEVPGRRPCLVLMAGLPGTGKSTLARKLGQRAGFRVIRSDVVRKELAGIPLEQPMSAAVKEKIYSLDWSERTYAECLRQAEQGLWEGERIVVDANFRKESQRRPFLEAAARWTLPAVFCQCEAVAETVRGRLQTRAGDASDADWNIYQSAVRAWEEPGPETRDRFVRIDSAGSEEGTLAKALEILHSIDVY